MAALLKDHRCTFQITFYLGCATTTVIIRILTNFSKAYKLGIKSLLRWNAYQLALFNPLTISTITNGPQDGILPELWTYSQPTMNKHAKNFGTILFKPQEDAGTVSIYRSRAIQLEPNAAAPIDANNDANNADKDRDNADKDNEMKDGDDGGGQ
eukprot:117646_1